MGQASPFVSGQAVGEVDVSGTYRSLSRFSSELIRSRQRFGGDLDRLMILMVFTLSRLEALQRERTGQGRRRIEGLNALSIADITGLPRETARRKLMGMVEEGRLLRSPDGLYSCCGDINSLLLDVEPLMGRA